MPSSFSRACVPPIRLILGGGKAFEQASLPVHALVCSFEVAGRLQALTVASLYCLGVDDGRPTCADRNSAEPAKVESVLRSGPVASQGPCVNILLFRETSRSWSAAWRFGRNSRSQVQTGFEPV